MVLKNIIIMSSYLYLIYFVSIINTMVNHIHTHIICKQLNKNHCISTVMQPHLPIAHLLCICIDQAFSSGLATRDSPNTEVQTTQQHLCRTPVGEQVALADKLGANVDAIPLGIVTT